MTDLIKQIFGTDRGSALEHGNIPGFLGKSVGTAVQAVLTGIEASSPTAAAIIKVLESLDGKAPTNPISAISDIGAVVAVFDPTIVTDFKTKVNGFLEAEGLQAEEAKVDALVVALFASVGITAPAAPAS